MSSSFLWCEERHWNGNPRSHIFSHVRCLWELESSCSILVLSLASCLRSSGWTTLCISLDHFCIIFSRSSLLPGVFLTLRVSSSSNSSLVFHLNPGCLSKSLHTSSFIFWETLFIFGACFPVVSTSSQLLTRLTCELLPHRSFIFPGCLDEEAECLVNQGCCFLGSRG